MYSKKEASNKMDAGITVQNEIEDIHHPSSTIYHIASSIKSKVENASKELPFIKFNKVEVVHSSSNH